MFILFLLLVFAISVSGNDDFFPKDFGNEVRNFQPLGINMKVDQKLLSVILEHKLRSKRELKEDGKIDSNHQHNPQDNPETSPKNNPETSLQPNTKHDPKQDPQSELVPKKKMHVWTIYDTLMVIFLILVLIYVRRKLYNKEGDNCCFGCKWGRLRNETPEVRTEILNQQETTNYL
ncbi:uncharacterized protein LOC121467531 [Drosophila elegans]|uniref:uncharacterized protein LOC121467531 n=1 Tax=Drosophila elegans TaxID=30023 RepID=UPI001BC864C2|nr:uncharacterized protein LOC121467531 [Drosophila elegans]